MKQYYYILFLFSTMMIFFPINSAAETGSTYVLVEGTMPREGIPGFGPNAIHGLYGKYAAGGGSAFAEVWAVSEPLLFGNDRWTETKVGGVRALYTGAEKGRKVWAVPRELAVREKSDIPGRWIFIVNFGSETQDEACRIFVDVAVRRTEAFFISARRLSDLSFPATVIIAGKN
jgi:hypothetical protein